MAPREPTTQLQEITAEKGLGVAMGRERDILRTGVAAVTVMERVAFGMAIAHVMEMVVDMEMDTGTQKAAVAAVMSMAIGMRRTGMEEVQAGMERAGEQMMVEMEKAGKKVVIVKARWTPRWTARWTRWTVRQIRQLMVLLSRSHLNARKVDGTVRGYVLQCEVSSLILFLERFW